MKKIVKRTPENELLKVAERTPESELGEEGDL
jgi:hypothetical protein